MNKYIVGTNKNPYTKQRRRLQMIRMEQTKQEKKKVSFRIKIPQDNKSVADDVVEECRNMFRKEIQVLGQELLKFRETCEQEFSRYKSELQQRKEENTSVGTVLDTTDTARMIPESTSLTETWSQKLNSLQKDMDHLAKKQSQLDRENMLADEEESILQRKEELEIYEKEIEEIESGLDRRQERCQKRQNDLLALEEELDMLKMDLENKKDTLNSLGVDTGEADRRAKGNLHSETLEETEHIKNNLLEKQSFLQKKIDQYRTELATLKTTCTAKDISIQKLQSQVEELQENLEKKNSKIDQLNTQLSFVLQEAKSKENEQNKKPLDRKNSMKMFWRQSSFRKQDTFQRQSSTDFNGREKRPSIRDNNRWNNSHDKSVKHPMRDSIDVTNNKFQMGLQPPSSEESRACIVM